MKYSGDKVTAFVAEMDKKSLSAQELVAVGKILVTLGEVQKENEYLEEYLKMSMTSDTTHSGNLN